MNKFKENEISKIAINDILASSSIDRTILSKGYDINLNQIYNVNYISSKCILKES